MWKNKKVSVIMPAYNEEENIRNAVMEYSEISLVDEVVVVDNNSTDKTPDELKNTSARQIHEQKQGYGFALRRGLAEASGDLIIMVEPDGTFVANDVNKLLVYSDDFDMVCGTRTNREMIWKGANMRYFLMVGNWAVAKLLEFLFGTSKLTDCGCTLRLINRRALNKICAKLTVGSSHFLPEMVILSKINDVKFIEIPVNYRSRIGQSKITGNLKGTIKTGVNMILLIFYYRMKFFKNFFPFRFDFIRKYCKYME